MKLIKEIEDLSVLKNSDGLKKEISIRTHNKAKEIHTWVKFYNYTKSQAYVIPEDKTYTKLTLTVRMPKWMIKKCEDIYNICNRQHFMSHIVFYAINADYFYSIRVSTPWDYSYGMSYINDGLTFMSNYKMIALKKDLNSSHKKFMSVFKQFNNSELEYFVKYNSLPYSDSPRIAGDELQKVVLSNNAAFNHLLQQLHEMPGSYERDILINIDNLV